MFPCFDLFMRIQKLLVLPIFASILDFFQYAFKNLISRANSSDISVHFFHKSSCAIFIPLDELDRFCKFIFLGSFCLLHYVCYVFFLLLYGYFHDCVHLCDFTLEKNT